MLTNMDGIETCGLHFCKPYILIQQLLLIRKTKFYCFVKRQKKKRRKKGIKNYLFSKFFFVYVKLHIMTATFSSLSKFTVSFCRTNKPSFVVLFCPVFLTVIKVEKKSLFFFLSINNFLQI